MKEVYEKWENYHKGKEMRKDFSPMLEASWEKSQQKGVDPYKAMPTKLDSEIFRKIKHKSKALMIYANSIVGRLIYNNFEEEEDGLIGGAVFDDSGCLLKIYGNHQYKRWIESVGIEEGQVWSEEVIGANACSIGLKNMKTKAVVGEKNFSKFLVDTACYFSPISLKEHKTYGGLLIAVPAKNENDYLLHMTLSVARSIELQILWFSLTGQFAAITEGYGLISLDQSRNENRILYISDSMLKILKVNSGEISYEKLEEVINPLPANKEFWNIVNKKSKIQDKNIKLEINGEEHSVNMSTSKFKDSKFNMDGLLIAINSSERINKLVSKVTGNNARYTFEDIIGKDYEYVDTLKRARVASFSESNILLLGESGTGKDVLAQAIHNNGKRKNFPFVAVNCAAFSKELIASELFGYEDGAYTGARKGGNIGKFELANNGTLFLDEIGDMPLDLQATLLRVIEERSFRKVGGNTLTNVNVRIIAATNKDLEEKIRQGLFRADLFYRLGIIRIKIPPLRNRKADVILFAEYFIKIICDRIKRDPVEISSSAKNFLEGYSWPGNVRELMNLLDGIIQTHDESVITEEMILKYLGQYSESHSPKKEPTEIKEDEKETILKALIENKNNKVKAAQALGMSRRTLYRRLSEYEIET